MIGDVSGGTTVLSVTDPTGDDNGPGTYQYPTSSSYSAGSWDLTGFQVITAGSEVYLRTSLANLVPTFGSVDGAQLLDIYVHNPSATGTSTAAAFPTRNYTIAPADAWSERLEVQGFASPVWVNASGGRSAPRPWPRRLTGKTITIALPEAEFGTPTTGWTFTVAITGQNGFNADQAISFTTNPGAFTLESARSAAPSRSARSSPAAVSRGDGHHHARPASPRTPSSTRPSGPSSCRGSPSPEPFPGSGAGVSGCAAALAIWLASCACNHACRLLVRPSSR